MKKINDYYMIESLITGDKYYTNSKLPLKVIDGKTFITVKKNINDKNTFFMLKENMRVVK